MIIGLTDKPAAPPQLGTLRKGAPKQKNGNKPGEDLKHFRFDSKDAGAVTIFREIYGEEPRAIRVYVPFPTTDQNFEAWREAWAASSLLHRCDGQTMVRWLTPKGTYCDEPKPCAGGCKQVGRLKLIIPELKRFAVVDLITTSIHDILEIHSNLLAIESLRGSLKGIPLIIKRAPRKISTPGDDGKRARREKWLITIEAQPQWVELQLSAQLREALPGSEPLALPEWDGDDDADDDGEQDLPPRNVGQQEPPRANKPASPRNGSTAKSAETAAISDEEKALNEALLGYWLKQKGDRTGKVYFDNVYAKKSLDEKREAAKSLGLVVRQPAAAAAAQQAPEVIEAEIVEEAPAESASLNAHLEIEQLTAELQRAGCNPDHINAKIAKVAGGVYAIDELDSADLPKVRQMLKGYAAMGVRAAAEMAKEFKQ